MDSMLLDSNAGGLGKTQLTFNWLWTIGDQCHLEELCEDEGAEVDLDLWTFRFGSRTEHAILEHLWDPLTHKEEVKFHFIAPGN
jgi:hypothetical protein